MRFEGMRIDHGVSVIYVDTKFPCYANKSPLPAVCCANETQ